jgi:glycosyltransferase involved in cell wall biosynthesis
MGEHARATFRALRAVGVDAHLRDVYGLDGAPATETGRSLRSHLVPRLGSDVSIFVLNGDEREQAFRHLGSDMTEAGYKIVYPAWELSRYPEVWARELEQYDEVWAASAFSREAFAGGVNRPVFHLPLPCQPVLTRRFSRRHFGVSECSFVFVLFFDFTSFIDRKNPFGVLAAFAKLRAARPLADVQLVIKVGSKHAAPSAHARLLEALEPHGRHAVLIDRTLDDDEVKSLIAAGDAFVSLHRAEGFGFGPAEAMYFGKPVIATGYSGNMDYMTADTACLVNYSLVPVREGQYPHAAGQVWAEPDLDEAATRMIRLVDEPERGREIGARASSHVRTYFSLRAAGLRYASRLDEISRDASGARSRAELALP